MKDRTQELRTVSNSDRTAEAGGSPRWREGEKAMARRPRRRVVRGNRRFSAFLGLRQLLFFAIRRDAPSKGKASETALGGERAGEAAVATFSFF